MRTKVKTGKQVFEEIILENIDNSVTVTSIIDDSEMNFVFQVCDSKWMMPGMPFVDKNNVTWGVVNIDYDTDTITTLVPGEDVSMETGDVLYIQKPTFLSGTPLDTNAETKLRLEADVALIPPYVWLLESIELGIPAPGDSQDREFRFKWFCLCPFNAFDWLNNDRHAKVIYPMTQLNQWIMNVIDYGISTERFSKADSRELSKFGKETERGFESYILDMNLSGVSCAATVLVYEKHYCKC